ncbi:alpha/beta-hydrolase [Didymella exigua CBS 183.55]|uniref:Alpha/beta-hydrolase n=1 Tax=Didymella exigua CBS 183.55 TaxID=1150837 RepID=A0A6A5RYD9_9PLEO|nr:alpha/beta-hydrolase [Didymella exigua CBS 183.55]KAF1933495.1 alpha/beta-hydrolase [Didymella exigua CBS 183.55]
MTSPPLIVDPTGAHMHTVIFLHGRGSNATEFCSEIFESQDSSGLCFPKLFPSVKWVFPCVNVGWSELDHEEVHRWFGMISRLGLEDSRTQLLGIVEEGKFVMRERIILGISQGCAVALWALLSADVCIGGFFGLCGWLPSADELVNDHGTLRGWRNAGNMPILLQHCKDDGVVQFANGMAMRNCLEELRMDVKWQYFEEGGHWLNEPEGMDGIVEFLKSVIANEPQ